MENHCQHCADYYGLISLGELKPGAGRDRMRDFERAYEYEIACGAR